MTDLRARVDEAMLACRPGPTGHPRFADVRDAAIRAVFDALARPSDQSVHAVIERSAARYGARYGAFGPMEWHIRAWVEAAREENKL